MSFYQLPLQKKFNASKWFYIFLSLHTLAWTIAPTLVRYTLPMDAIEGFVWGQHWQFGYDRNPYLNGWLTSLAAQIGGTFQLPIYLLSQVCVGLCFWSVFRLGKKFLAPIHAMIAVMLLEALQYYSIASIDFGDNVLEIGLWALLTLSFYNLLKERKSWQFLLTAFLAALALMTKYYALVIFIPMLVFTLVQRETRTIFRNRWFYLATALFCSITIPHFIWLIHNHYSTLQYAMSRAYDWSDAHTTIIYFLGSHLLSLAGLLVLFATLFIAQNNSQNLTPIYLTKTSVYDKRFLLILGFGPIITTILIAAIFHMALHVMWGTPLFYMWGILLLVWTKPKITKSRIVCFLCFVFFVMFAQIAGYTYAQVYSKKNHSSANYPAKNISQKVLQIWQNKYRGNLPYIIGDRYIAGDVAYFIKNNCQRPEVYVAGESELNAKIDINDLKKRGAILLWQGGATNNIPTDLSQEFPQAKFLETDAFSWRRNHDGSNVEIGIGIIAPQNTAQ